MESITLNAHAKINLSLRIIGKRPDGYHEIVSFMQGTGLHDVVTIKKCSGNATKYTYTRCNLNGLLVYLCTASETMPMDKSNLAFKGAEAFLKAYEGDALPEEVTIEIDKRLPVAAGIAGGSGNAAAAMLGLNALAGHPLSLRELMSAGSAVGADVPFSLFMNAYRNRDALKGLRGLEEAKDSAWTGGIGDIVEAAEPVTRTVILANPGTGVSTKAAYEAMDSIGYSDIDREDRSLFVNDMESYTLNEHAKAAELKRIMQEHLSADEVLMSGSGPSIIAYYKDVDKASEDIKLLTELTRNESGIRIWLTDTGKTMQGGNDVN